MGDAWLVEASDQAPSSFTASDVRVRRVVSYEWVVKLSPVRHKDRVPTSFDTMPRSVDPPGRGGLSRRAQAPRVARGHPLNHLSGGCLHLASQR